MMNCPTCHTVNNQVKAGKNQSGSQRYLCKTCSKAYTPKPNAIGYPFAMRHLALKLYKDGLSFRAIARQLDVGTQSVINWVRVGEYEKEC